MKFIPYGDRVLVKIEEQETTTPSGIVIPDSAKERPQTARVVEAGEDVEGIAAGVLVAFVKYSGADVKVDGEDYLILDADDVLGFFEEGG